MNKFVIVKEVINEWDPIDLLPHAPDDEYESEIRDIVKSLTTVKSVGELAVVINEVFIKWFGKNSVLTEEFSIKKCHPIALKIWGKIT
ncbi:DUF1871 family protein [Solibacillus cecembensis]|uniref:DUF1871 family protein n=1 Tax=Solibacillus cecembensis TaxID=459347 RepID=UPI003D05961D